jgi:two-component system LytT family response regulator
LKIAVIDDEKPQADILYSICNAYFGGHKQNVQIDCFPDGIAFFNSFKKNTYKIAFVDIFMKKMNGIAVAEKLREKDRDILIVFVTTSPDFMMQAFSVHAFHYITKPYKAEQIYKVLDDASSYVSDNSKYIEVMCDRRNTLISLKEIVSVESDQHRCCFGTQISHTNDHCRVSQACRQRHPFHTRKQGNRAECRLHKGH